MENIEKQFRKILVKRSFGAKYEQKINSEDETIKTKSIK